MRRPARRPTTRCLTAGEWYAGLTRPEGLLDGEWLYGSPWPTRHLHWCPIGRETYVCYLDDCSREPPCPAHRRATKSRPR